MMGLAQHQGPKPILGVDSIGPTQVVLILQSRERL
jgi:hypothetical protein